MLNLIASKRNTQQEELQVAFAEKRSKSAGKDTLPDLTSNVAYQAHIIC